MAVTRAKIKGYWVLTAASARTLGAVALAIVLLNQSLAFYNVWPTPRVAWRGHLSAEAALALLAVLLWAWRAPGRIRASSRLLAALWVPLVVGRYLDVAAPALYGRPVNLYWDLRHLSAVAAMMTDAVSGAAVAGLVAAVVAGLVGLYLLALWAFRQVAAAAAHPKVRATLGIAATTALALYALERGTGMTAPGVAFAPPVSESYWRHARTLAVQLASREQAVAASRQSTESDLSRVDGADVFLVFVESYGATTYDRPDLAAPLAAARARFAADIAASGREVVSAFVGSPTFGGSSWLAHVTLMTGVETRDEGANATLMAQRRDTLVTAFARAGYRTVALMPGLQHQWPEGAFYGFDQIYDAAALAYQGPRFGWWTVPDQFALARLDALEGRAPGDPPRFVFFPTTSTHAPFGPTAPYQPDWARMLSPEPYGEPDLGLAQARVPDYLNLAPSYANAVTYAYATLGGYLRTHAGRDVVLVILGDHQPAAAVSGEGASWDVPVHVVASRAAVLERFRAGGFRDGLAPPRAALGPMHGLLPLLLDAFGNRTPARAAR